MGKTSLLAACQAQRTFGDKSSLDPGLSTLVTISFSELTNTLMLIINHYVNYYKKKNQVTVGRYPLFSYQVSRISNVSQYMSISIN